MDIAYNSRFFSWVLTKKRGLTLIILYVFVFESIREPLLCNKAHLNWVILKYIYSLMLLWLVGHY